MDARSHSLSLAIRDILGVSPLSPIAEAVEEAIARYPLSRRPHLASLWGINLRRSILTCSANKVQVGKAFSVEITLAHRGGRENSHDNYNDNDSGDSVDMGCKVTVKLFVGDLLVAQREKEASHSTIAIALSIPQHSWYETNTPCRIEATLGGCHLGGSPYYIEEVTEREKAKEKERGLLSYIGFS